MATKKPVQAPLSAIQRPTREATVVQDGLFGNLQPTWQDHYWGMPDFKMGDASAQYRIVVNFMTKADLEDFCARLGTKGITTSSDTMFWPQQKRMNGEYMYADIGKPVQPKYPICIPSKGRYDVQITGKLLDEMGIHYRFFVEQQEYEAYKSRYGEDKVVSMPFSNLGQGSIPARNFIWDWAEKNGHSRHWVVDDNITKFSRMYNNRRVRCKSSGLFRAMETFVDRYENIALAGPHDQGFIVDRDADTSPIHWNSRVYSCTLVNTNLQLEERWRGRYNEDTDLSLRLLKLGYCTVLFKSLLMNKGATAYSKGAKPLKGGNTDNVYNTGDHRLAFAQSLKDQHPDVVDIVWKFNRYHHQVNYKPFIKNKPILKAGVTKVKPCNEFGMSLMYDDSLTESQIEALRKNNGDPIDDNIETSNDGTDEFDFDFEE